MDKKMVKIGDTILVFKPKRIEEVDIRGLDREEKFKKYNELAIDDNKRVQFDNEFAHLADNIIVQHGEWIEMEEIKDGNRTNDR